MKISYNWLKEYVNFYLSPHELADKLTNVGLVVADIQTVDDDFCLEVEVTSNRPDCLGIIGIGREVVALGGGCLHLPETSVESVNKEILSSFGIDPSSEIADDIAKRMEDLMKNTGNFFKDKYKGLKDKGKTK